MFFPRNDRPYGLKRTAIQTENALMALWVKRSSLFVCNELANFGGKFEVSPLLPQVATRRTAKAVPLRFAEILQVSTAEQQSSFPSEQNVVSPELIRDIVS